MNGLRFIIFIFDVIIFLNNQINFLFVFILKLLQKTMKCSVYFLCALFFAVQIIFFQQIFLCQVTPNCRLLSMYRFHFLQINFMSNMRPFFFHSNWVENFSFHRSHSAFTFRYFNIYIPWWIKKAMPLNLKAQK